MAKGEQKAGFIQWMETNKYSGKEIASVEIASYVLLSYSLKTNSNNEGLPVFIGIQREMSETGGFSTTQDTVIGIQAMSAYAILMDSATSMNQNIQTHLLDSNDSKIKSSQPIVMDDTNKMIVKIQNLEFNDQTTQVEMKSNGQGTIYAQIVQHYYIPDNTIEPFKVEVIVNENDPAIKRKRRSSSTSTKVRSGLFLK